MATVLAGGIFRELRNHLLLEHWRFLVRFDGIHDLLTEVAVGVVIVVKQLRGIYQLEPVMATE